MHYTLNIIAYLNLLGDFDQTKIAELEDQLVGYLQEHSVSNSRFRRLKYDRKGSEVKHLEAHLLFEWFRAQFLEKMDSAHSDTERNRLEAWIPTSTLSLYYYPEKLSA